jgi:hypothetical protein
MINIEMEMLRCVLLWPGRMSALQHKDAPCSRTQKKNSEFLKQLQAVSSKQRRHEDTAIQTDRVACASTQENLAASMR